MARVAKTRGSIGAQGDVTRGRSKWSTEMGSVIVLTEINKVPAGSASLYSKGSDAIVVAKKSAIGHSIICVEKKCYWLQYYL